MNLQNKCVHLFFTWLAIFVGLLGSSNLSAKSSTLPIPEWVGALSFFIEDQRDNPTVRHLIENLERPEFLFHWSSKKVWSEDRRGDSSRELPLDEEGKLVLPPSNNAIFNSFLNRRGGVLYFWSHPVTGMGISKSENYAEYNEEAGKASTLLVARPKSDATFGIYVSTPGPWVKPDSVLSPDSDWVLHIRTGYEDEVLWQEWVLQNPEAADWVSADPEETKPIVDRYLNEFELESSPSYLFHSVDSRYVPYNWQERIEKSLEVTPQKTSLLRRCLRLFIRN